MDHSSQGGDIPKSDQTEVIPGDPTTELELLKAELTATQQQLNEAHSQIEAKTKELQDAYDQIFQLQPYRKDMTESEAREAYKSLCGNVQRWVENRLKDALDDLEHRHLGAWPISPEAPRFIGLLRESSRRCLTVGRSDEYHAMAIIMNYLNQILFSQPFYCPLGEGDSDGTMAWIDWVEGTLSRLSRDDAHCRGWRIEALTALTHQSTFKSRRSRHLNKIAEDLATLMSVVVPRTPLSELQKSLKRNIIEPAAELAHQLHLASCVFSLKWPIRSAATRLEFYQCLDLASDGGFLDLSGTGQTTPERARVAYLFDVAPGLFVERIQGGKKTAAKAIAKPTVLVCSTGEAQHRPTIMDWLWNRTSRNQGSSRSAARIPASTRTTEPGMSSYRRRQ